MPYFTRIKDMDQVGFEPTASAVPQLSPDYSLPPLKEKLLKEKNCSNIRRSIFHALQPLGAQ
jgi:hypothetical protein